MKRFLAVASSYGLNRVVISATVLVPSLLGMELADVGQIELLVASVSLAWAVGPLGTIGIAHEDFIDRRIDWWRSLGLAAVGGAVAAGLVQQVSSGAWIVLALVLGALGSMQKVVQNRLRVDRSPSPVTIASLAMVAAFTGGIVGSRLLGRWNPASAPLALAGAMLVFTLIGLWLVRPQLHDDGSRFQDLLRYGLPLAIASLFHETIALADRFFVDAFVGTAQVGVYGVAARFVALIASAASAVAIFWNAESLRRGYDWAITIVRRHAAPWIAFLLVAAAATWYPVTWVAARTLRLPVAELGLVVALLLVGAVGMVIGTQLISVLSADRRSLPGAVAKGLGMVTNVGLNFVAVPLFGITGAAATTAVSQAVVALVAWRYLLRRGRAMDAAGSTRDQARRRG